MKIVALKSLIRRACFRTWGVEEAGFERLAIFGLLRLSIHAIARQADSRTRLPLESHGEVEAASIALTHAANAFATEQCIILE